MVAFDPTLLVSGIASENHVNPITHRTNVTSRLTVRKIWFGTQIGIRLAFNVFGSAVADLNAAVFSERSCQLLGSRLCGEVTGSSCRLREIGP